MIIAVLIYLTVYLSRSEAAAWDLVSQAQSHEAVVDPSKPGHKAAMDWVVTTKTRAETLRMRTAAIEDMMSVLAKFTAGCVASLAVLRIAASAMHDSAAAVVDIAASAGWSTVVDGIDVLLWLALVV